MSKTDYPSVDLNAILNVIRTEWDLLMGLAGAAGAALTSDEEGAGSPQ